MEITTQERDNVELISVRGRVDSVQAVQFEEALTAATRRGKHKLVIDLGQVEYMSSAGFWALAAAQRMSKRHNGGEVMLTQVPGLVHEALEMVGFTEHFKIIDPLASALEYARDPSRGVPASKV